VWRFRLEFKINTLTIYNNYILLYIFNSINMSELSSSQIGTREYFETRIIPPNSRKQELLMKLQQKVWREVAMQLPETSRPNEVELSDLKLLKNNDAWSDLFHNKDRNKSIFEKVQTNIIFHQMESLQ
jgi:hypothetical protein